MKAPKINYILMVLLATAVACSGGRGRNFTEGTIEYSVSYDTSTTARFNPRLLPSSLSIEFKNNNTKTTIEALSGAISFALVKNYKEQQYTTLIKVVGKKLKHTEKFDSTHYPALYAGVPIVEIDTVVEELVIDGFNCKKVIGNFANVDQKFEIIYTNDIRIDNPNANTPFEPIDGVLLEFNLRLDPIVMQLKMKNITKERVNQSTFDVPKEYGEVDFKTMTDIMSALQR